MVTGINYGISIAYYKAFVKSMGYNYYFIVTLLDFSIALCTLPYVPCSLLYVVFSMFYVVCYIPNK